MEAALEADGVDEHDAREQVRPLVEEVGGHTRAVAVRYEHELRVGCCC